MSDKTTSTLNKLAEEIVEQNEEVSMEALSSAVQHKRSTMDLAELQIKQTRFLEAVRKEPKVSISVSPQYAAEFSNNMRVTINGISIFIPIDGRDYLVPQSFADEIKRRIHKVNQKLNRFKRRGNTNNVVMIEEKSIGEVKLN